MYTVEIHKASGNYQVVLTLDYLRHVIAINLSKTEAEATAERLNNTPRFAWVKNADGTEMYTLV